MKKTNTFYVLFLFTGLTALSFYSCRKEANELKADPDNVNYKPFLPTEDISQLDLGRVLFYDRFLSVNNSVSCGSCHKQSRAFADDVALSKGFNNQLTTRNSMPIQNLSSISFMEQGGEHALFWDGRETSLSEMVLRPVASHIEMGITDMDYLCEKLSGISYYPTLFERDFGSPEINSERIRYALSGFISGMNSFNSKFDQGQPLTATETLGKNLFETKYPCNSCHNVGSPTGYLNGGEGGTAFSNIGLDIADSDRGVGAISGNPADDGKFKIPSLRNIALTAPYMHDGRFNTLEEVLDHYSNTMMEHPNLDERLKEPNGDALRMQISEQEKTAIIAFLNTMTDFEFITDPQLSDPFNR